MRTPYTYTVLRYVHDIATGEFINVGVALFAPDHRYASALCRNTYGRVSKTFPGVDGEAFKRLMRFVQARIDQLGERMRSELPLESLPETALELARQIVPQDDSSLQWSPLGGGLTEDPSHTLESLYERLVAIYEDRDKNERRSDDDVWRKYKRDLESRHVTSHLRPMKIAVQDDEIEFDHAFKNGKWHCLEAVSFDLSLAESVREKAHRWLGQMTSVMESPEPFKLYLLIGEPQHAELQDAFEKAMSILHKIPVDKEIIRESDSCDFSARFLAEVIESH